MRIFTKGSGCLGTQVSVEPGRKKKKKGERVGEKKGKRKKEREEKEDI